MKKNNKFRLIFKHQQNLETVEVEYELHDSVVAQKWFKKIKHLANVPVDLVETELVDLNDLRKIYHDFCAFANLTPIAIDVLDQDTLNRLHKIYEDTHDDLSRRKNNSILYLDLYPLFLGKNKKAIASYYEADGVHLSTEGYEVWARALEETVFRPLA